MPGSPRPTAPRLGLESLEARDVPATFGVADAYNATANTLLQVPFTTGVLANDFSDTNPGNVLSARRVGLPQFVTIGANNVTGTINPNSGQGFPFPPLLQGSLTLNSDGSFSLRVPATLPAGADGITFSYIATDVQTGLESAPTQVIIRLQSQAIKVIAVGSDAGGSPEVRVYQAGTSVLRNTYVPYEATFTGGVRVAVGDINGDGIDDIATIPQAGGSDRLRVFNGVDGSTLIDQFVFSTADVNYRSGGYIAIGDLNGDGRKDIIVGAGEGGGPRVRVLTYNPAAAFGSTSLLADFFAYDSSVRSGVRVAAGRLDSAARGDSLITTPGIGGGPQVNVYSGISVRGARTIAPQLSFFAGSANNRDGIYVTTANLSGNGNSDIVIGTGAGSSMVTVYDGRTGGLTRTIDVSGNDSTTGSSTVTGGASGQGGLTPGFTFTGASNGTLTNTASPGTLVPASTGPGVSAIGVPVTPGGARVAATDFNSDGIDDIIVANGPGFTSRVRVINPLTATEITSIFPFPSTFLGGVNVAASSS